MKYEVCPGQCLIHSGSRYGAGAIVPGDVEVESLCVAGIIRAIEDNPIVRPDPVPQARSTSVEGFDSSDPSTVTNVPLRLLPGVLKDIDDGDLLLEMHEADSRKGGRDLIEERLGELETDDA